VDTGVYGDKGFVIRWVRRVVVRIFACIACMNRSMHGYPPDAKTLQLRDKYDTDGLPPSYIRQMFFAGILSGTWFGACLGCV
jgi:hypothetical protein